MAKNPYPVLSRTFNVGRGKTMRESVQRGRSGKPTGKPIFVNGQWVQPTTTGGYVIGKPGKMPKVFNAPSRPFSGPLRGSNGKAATGPLAGMSPKEIKAMQAFLRAKGYNISADGVAGKDTERAFDDWNRADGDGKRNPRAVGLGFPVAPKGGAGGGAPKGKKGGAGGGGGGRSLQGLGSGLGPDGQFQFLSEALAKGGAQPLDGSYADALAGAQFDPGIHELNTELARQPADQAQALKDIESWYGQTLGAFKTAQGRNKAAGDAAAANIGSIAQAVAASLGGNQAGAALVGAQGAQDAATTGQMTLAEDQYQNDMQPLLQAEAAAASKTQTIRGQNAHQDLLNKLVELQGQRGQAKAGAMYDLSKYNNDIRDKTLDRLLQIKQYNNQLKQQRFGNALSAQEAAIAAAMGGAQIDALRADTATRKKTAKSGFIPWAQLSSADKATLIDHAVAPFIKSDGSLTTNRAWAEHLARQTLRGQGFMSADRGTRAFKQNPKAAGEITAALRARLFGAANPQNTQ